MKDTAPPTSCTERAHLTLNLVNLRPQVAFVRGQRHAICRESPRVASSAPMWLRRPGNLRDGGAWGTGPPLEPSGHRTLPSFPCPLLSLSLSLSCSNLQKT